MRQARSAVYNRARVSRELSPTCIYLTGERRLVLLVVLVFTYFFVDVLLLYNVAGRQRRLVLITTNVSKTYGYTSLYAGLSVL